MVNAGTAGPHQTPKAMLMDNDLYNQCLATVTELDAELGWGLSEAVREQYARAVVGLVDAERLEQRMWAIVQNYHEDHQRLAILRQPNHPDHNHAWEQVKKHIANIMQKNNLAWSSDQAIDRDDLVQIACTAVADKLHTFRFESRFTTWITPVAVRSGQRTVRDSLAQKRAGRPDSLDLIESSALPTDSHFERHISERLLVEQISAILQTHKHPQAAEIFLLRHYQGLGTKEIGERLYFHPSRVRALLAEAKALLQDDPSLRDWLEDQRDGDDPRTM